MTNKKSFSCTVTIYKFLSGFQGGAEIIEQSIRAVYSSSIYYPVKNLCSHLPLQKQTFYWIRYKNQRFPVDIEKLGDNKVSARLYLSSEH